MMRVASIHGILKGCAIQPAEATLVVQEFGLVRVIHLVPGIKSSSTLRWRPHRKAACGKTAIAV